MDICGLFMKWITSFDVDAVFQEKKENRKTDRWVTSGEVCQDSIMKAAVDCIQKLCQQLPLLNI